MDGEALCFLVVFATLSGLVGLWIARLKNRSPIEGLALGFVLGPIGWIVEALLEAGAERPVIRLIPGPRAHRECPFCAETILAEAIVCRYCSRDIPMLLPPVQDKTPLFRDSLMR